MKTQPFLKAANLKILGVDMNGSGKDFVIKIKVDGDIKGAIYLTGKLSLVGKSNSYRLSQYSSPTERPG